jgi:hypothetical protein
LLRKLAPVSDRIPPGDELIKVRATRSVTGAKGINVVPHSHIESSEVGSYARASSVASVQLSALRQRSANEVLERSRLNNAHDEVGCFAVEVPTKSLKLSRHSHEVGVIDLGRRISPPRSGASHRLMHVEQFIELGGLLTDPNSKRSRGHALRLLRHEWAATGSESRCVARDENYIETKTPPERGFWRWS